MEQDYLNLLQSIIEDNNVKESRTGEQTLSKTCAILRLNVMRNNERIIPLLTTKKMNLKHILNELLWFISGSTNNNVLNDLGTNIWDSYASKDYIDSLGLNYDEGELGPIYGYQWRSFGGNYPEHNGVDQLQEVIDNIKNNPYSRRHLVISWNAKQLKQMVLPPCHILFQFISDNTYLDCVVYMRSGDLALGVPYNLVSYTLLLHMVSIITQKEARELSLVIGDAHIYKSHIKNVRRQIKRKPKDFPTIKIKEKNNIDDFVAEDFELGTYEPQKFLYYKCF